MREEEKKLLEQQLNQLDDGELMIVAHNIGIKVPGDFVNVMGLDREKLISELLKDDCDECSKNKKMAEKPYRVIYQNSKRANT